MIVYAESNFVLELAFQQDGSLICEKFLSLAQASITLVLPAFALNEPYWTLEHRIRERRLVHENLRREFTQLSRSKEFASKSQAFDDVTELIIQSIELHRQSLDDVVQKILGLSEIIPTDRLVVERALELKHRVGLNQHDALILSSILIHGESSTEQKCFVTTNSKDFENPDIELALSRIDCKLFSKFEPCLNYTKSKLAK